MTKLQSNAEKQNSLKLMWQRLEIDEYELQEKNIFVEWHYPSMEQNEQSSISRNEFEEWLSSTGKLDWCATHTDETGTIVPIEGRMEIEEYWDEAGRLVVIADLKDYLVNNLNLAA